MPMCTLTVLSASPRLSPSTTWTASSTFPPTMPAETLRLSSLPPRLVDIVGFVPYTEILMQLQAWGEEVVRSIYPETTIVRPAPMFGFEDNLLHKLAGVSNLFTANHMQERYWPVHVSRVTPLTRPAST